MPRSDRRPPLRRPPLRKQIPTLLAGSAGGQALALAMAPALTRLYTPDSFARLGLLVAAASFLAPLATLGLEAAIVLETDDRRSREATGLVLALASAASLAIAVLASPMLAAATACLAAVAILSSRALAAGRPRAASAARLLRSAGTGATQLALACTAIPGGTALTAGLLAGTFAAVAAASILLRGTGRPVLALRTVPHLLHRHRTLLFWSAPQTLLNNAGNTAVPLLLARLAGAPALGAWTLANRVVMLPAVTIGEAMRQSLLATMSAEASDDDACRRLLTRATLGLGLPLALLAALGFVAAPALFALVFGPPWREAGRDAALLFAAEAAGIANIPAVVLLTVRRWQRPFFLFGAATVPLRIAAVALAAATGGAHAALATHAALSAASSLAVGLGVRRQLGSPDPAAADRAPAPA